MVNNEKTTVSVNNSIAGQESNYNVVHDYPFSSEELKNNYDEFRVKLHDYHGGIDESIGYEFAMFIVNIFLRSRKSIGFRDGVQVKVVFGSVFTCEGEAPYFYPDTLTVDENILRSWGFTDADIADVYHYTKEYRCVKGTTI